MRSVEAIGLRPARHCVARSCIDSLLWSEPWTVDSATCRAVVYNTGNEALIEHCLSIKQNNRRILAHRRMHEVALVIDGNRETIAFMHRGKL